MFNIEVIVFFIILSTLTLKGTTVISLLPGSRVQEVSRMLPIFANTMELLKDNVPQLMTVIHVAPNEDVENFIAGAVQRWPVPSVLIPGGTTRLRYDAFSVRLIFPLYFHLHNKFFSTHYVKTCRKFV